MIITYSRKSKKKKSKLNKLTQVIGNVNTNKVKMRIDYSEGEEREYMFKLFYNLYPED